MIRRFQAQWKQLASFQACLQALIFQVFLRCLRDLLWA